MKTYPQKNNPEKAPKPAPPGPPKPTGLWVPTPEGCLSDTDPLSGIHWPITMWGPASAPASVLPSAQLQRAASTVQNHRYPGISTEHSVSATHPPRYAGPSQCSHPIEAGSAICAPGLRRPPVPSPSPTLPLSTRSPSVLQLTAHLWHQKEAPQSDF